MTDDELINVACRVLNNAATVKVRVTKRDYSYDGYIVGLILKQSGAIRTVVEDNCGRLFIHNSTELTLI